MTIVIDVRRDRRQARVIFRYCRALPMEVPALAALVERIDGETIDPTNNLTRLRGRRCPA
jgi:hypothetical protein